MSSIAAAPEFHDLLQELSLAPNAGAARALVRRNPQLRSPAAVEWLHDEVVRLARVDQRRAARVAQTAEWLAEHSQDQAGRAFALRANGHIFHLTGRHHDAVSRYEAALEIFAKLGRELDVARTAHGAIQSLIYLGRYDQAIDWARRARQVFESQGNRLRVARVDLNLANIFYRQDRFQQAIELYKRAYLVFVESGEHQDVAVALRNMAVCYISLNDFTQALQTYRDARQYCLDHDLPILVAEADYNVAYLYYLRGEYTRAIELYDQTRELCEQLGDAYHSALCDLDQSEMYLELNLSESGTELAQRAHAGFTDLGMTYEAAKALTFSALAEKQLGRSWQSLQLFDRSRELFAREQNQVWPALIDLYKALTLFEQGVPTQARLLCRQALDAFLATGLLSKAAVCELLLARLNLLEGNTSAATERCAAAFTRIEKLQSPALEYQAWFVSGEVREAVGEDAAAYLAYQRAHEKLESLRSHLQAEELKIAFLKDKLQVYESLVHLALSNGQTGAQSAFDYIERAKSRSLADLIAFRAYELQPSAPELQDAGQRMRSLRQRLSTTYRQISKDELSGEHAALARAGEMRRMARQYENQLAGTLWQAENSDIEFASLTRGGTLGLATIQSAIPQDALLLEYYVSRGSLYVALVGHDTLDIVPLGAAAPLRDRLRLLQFQLSKFSSGHKYASALSASSLAATRSHLHEFHSQLIAPLVHKLRARHLVIVPHGCLHYLPFQALWDGHQYLAEQFSISYSPSASIFALCAAKTADSHSGALVLGVPDARAPQIEEEARSVAAAFKNARLYLGEEADFTTLSTHGPGSRFVHIAAHGLFRQDNAMFSSIRLGRSHVHLYDLYQLRFAPELVTLSGCGTGLNVVVGGDELLGLVRGLLYAGAHAVLVTLWDVHDESTATFMRAFYRRLATAANKAVALQEAMQELRESYPHPYYWASFVLIGKFF